MNDTTSNGLADWSPLQAPGRQSSDYRFVPFIPLFIELPFQESILVHVIVLLVIEQAGVGQNGSVDHASSDHGHPARCWLDQLGVGKEKGLGKASNDQHARQVVTEINVRSNQGKNSRDQLRVEWRDQMNRAPYRLYSGEISSAPAILPHVQLGTGARTKVTAGWLRVFQHPHVNT